MSEWPSAGNRSGALFDAGMKAYSRLWLVRTGVTDLVAAVIDAVEPLIRADERDLQRILNRETEGATAYFKMADLRAKVEALRAVDPHNQPVRDAYDAVLALFDGGSDD